MMRGIGILLGALVTTVIVVFLWSLLKGTTFMAEYHNIGIYAFIGSVLAFALPSKKSN